jgi:hypothetical protein
MTIALCVDDSVSAGIKLCALQDELPNGLARHIRTAFRNASPDSFMEPSTETLLAANALIRQYGEAAEEHASQQLWTCRQNADEEKADQWRVVLEAIKKVREIREKTRK